MRPRPRSSTPTRATPGFQGLERISDLICEGLTFAEALQVVRAGTVFTTHTPVPAGIDRFDRGLVQQYFSGDLLPGRRRVARCSRSAPRPTRGGSHDVFNMAVMGLRLGQHANGVSQLHGEVSRGMFAGLWPGFDSSDVPITSVTNGVHAPTWTDPLLLKLAEDKLGTSDTTAAEWSSRRRHRRRALGREAGGCARTSSPTRAAASPRPGTRRTPAPPRPRGSTRCSTPTCSRSASPVACRPTSGSP